MSDDLSGFSMMDLFRMEADERLTVLSQGLVALEESTATSEVIEPLMRTAHSLKGAARIVGLDAAVHLAHAMEDCLVAAQQGLLKLQPAHIDTLLRGVDLMVRLSQVPEAELDDWQSSHGAEVDSLVADMAAVQSGQPPAPTSPVTTPAPTAPPAVEAQPGLGAAPGPAPVEIAAPQVSPEPVPEKLYGRPAGSRPIATDRYGVFFAFGCPGFSTGRRRRACRPRRARHSREPHPVDGSGGGITRSDPPISPVRGIASAASGPTDRSPGDAPASGGSAVDRNGGAICRRARIALQGQARGGAMRRRIEPDS